MTVACTAAYHSKHGPAAVVHLGLLEPLEVLRHGGEAEGVEAKVPEERHKRTHSSVNSTFLDAAVVVVAVTKSLAYPGEEPSRWAGRGWPGIHSADMVTRPEVVALAQNGSRPDRDDGASRLGTPTALQLLNPLDDAIAIAATCRFLVR